MTTLRFADLFAATEHVMQHGGDVELSEDGRWWLVIRTAPDHDDPVHGHNPLCGDHNCRECVRLGWADVVEVESEVAAR